MGCKQHGFSGHELTPAKKKTKREQFLAEMEAVLPSQAGNAEGTIGNQGDLRHRTAGFGNHP